MRRFLPIAVDEAEAGRQCFFVVIRRDVFEPGIERRQRCQSFLLAVKLLIIDSGQDGLDGIR